jgi:S-adenosylmethionine:diacylglycerol 3-amino-3-carboxypropyl transferase
MYEDAAIERAAFRPGGRVFCIASAGCTALSLCDRHEVIACDINPAQLAYAERRIAGAPIEVGMAEKLMGFARRLVPLAGWNAGLMRAFLALEDPEEQVAVWRQRFDTWRFRAGFSAMMSATALRAVYAPEFLDFLPQHLGAVLRARMERCFARHPNARNPYANALLLAETVERTSTPRDAANIQLVLADATCYLESSPRGSFDAFTLSNILDGAAASYRDRLFAAVRRAASPDATVVVRSFAEPTGSTVANRAEHDRSMLWGIVHVQRVADLRSRPSREPTLLVGPSEID